MQAIRIRTHRLTAVSVGIHVLLLAWLILMPKITRDDVVITEITWVEPAPPAPPAPPAVVAKASPARQTQIPMAKPSVNITREHFKREQPLADITLKPQKTKATTDKLSERLAALQQRNTKEPASISTPLSPSPIGKSTLAGVSEKARPPKELSRNTAPGTAPIELNRTPTRVQQATNINAPMPERDVTPTKAKNTDNQAQRMLAGAKLVGPVADRPLLNFCKPEYPEWAKQEAVEGSVTIYFIVLPDGRIKENVMVQKTSGFGDFDDNAVKALLAWRFEPIERGKTGEQWGTITFHYRLSEF
jgi:TonB family protein